jgi:hypothetical protein
MGNITKGVCRARGLNHPGHHYNNEFPDGLVTVSNRAFQSYLSFFDRRAPAPSEGEFLELLFGIVL